MPEISLIVAIAQDYAIGQDGVMPWHLPADLKYFKNITLGHPVIMGRVTYDGLPIRPLPNRKNIVLTRKANKNIESHIEVNSLKKAIELCKNEKKVFIMGGASIYKQALESNLLDKLYITWVHSEFEADTYFPDWEDDKWQLVSCEDHNPDEKNKYPYSFCIYERIK